MNVADLEYKYTGQVPKATASSPFKIRVYSRANIQGLEAEIESSRRILKLPDNWDGEGSAPYLEKTLDRAIAFVRTHTNWLPGIGKEAPVPHINPGPEGSIDIHWKQPAWELLVNIPSDKAQKAVFYGHDYGSGTIKGTVDPDRRNFGLLEWLMK